MIMKILITGSYGRVGTAILDHLADHSEYTFTCLDKSDLPNNFPNKNLKMVVADVSEYEAIRPAFENQEVVIHLAAALRLAGDNWSKMLKNNIVGTYNVLEAAKSTGVKKVIFASSNHAVGRYEVEHSPQIYSLDFDLVLDDTAPVRPDSYYGVSKAFGEDIGRFYAELHGLRFYALRIGAVRSRELDHPYGDAEEGVRKGKWKRGDREYKLEVARLKAMWQSRRDLAELVNKCLQDDTVQFDIFYGVSDNDRSWFDIEHAREVIGYEPKDNAEEWKSPP